MIALLAAAAFADPVCGGDLPAPPDHLSVAWVSPLGARVGANGWLTVVPTAALRDYVQDQRPGVGRLLQHLGARKRSSDPHRRYKITIFDVEADALCRPIPDAAEETLAGGVPTCPAGRAELGHGYAGCGVLTDRGTGAPSLPVFRITWSDAAFAGFCVLPVERFLDTR